MSSGAQVNLDFVGPGSAGSDFAEGGASALPKAPNTRADYLTDEEILGIELAGSAALPPSSVILSEAKNPSSIARESDSATTRRDSSGNGGPQNDNRDTPSQHEASPQMPDWMANAAADPAHGGEAQALWREHQEFRAAFSSPEEARAMKELLPGGVQDVLSLREATQSVERIDAALFSGDARAQSEVVAELARANPAAFRSMFAEAARVLAGMGQGADAGGRSQKTGKFVSSGAAGDVGAAVAKENRRQDAGATTAGANRESAVENHESPVTSQQSPAALHESRNFDAAAYAAFERGTNDAVARDVRGSIGETLSRVLPEGVAEGAARRIGEDIFNDVHRALAADRALSEQVAAVLRERRFGGAEQQRVAALLAGRAKQLVPSVARRVIGEWTSTVLSTARNKVARQAAAASRVDIAAPGGSQDSMPLRAMSAREVNYASMSDEEILGT